tara:strand:- start:554 stop:1078 length:525 start_codon:yes stop_codon:yes gene_type:complete
MNTAAILAGLEVAGKVAPALLSAMPSQSEKQAKKAYQALLGYDPRKKLQQELPGLRQRILSATEEAKAQLGRGGLAGGRRNVALGKLYQSTLGALAKGEGDLRNKLMEQHLKSYTEGAKGLSGLGAIRQAAKTGAADVASDIDYSDTGAAYAAAQAAKRTQSTETGKGTTGGTF